MERLKYPYRGRKSPKIQSAGEVRGPHFTKRREAGEAGGTVPAVYNGANEECVAAFLAGTLAFPAIVDTIARVVSEHTSGPAPSAAAGLTLDDVLAADAWARTRARELTAG